MKAFAVWPLLAALALPGVAGASGPDCTELTPPGLYERANDSIPPAWTYDEHFAPADPVTDRWWQNFDDPVLDSLIVRGLAYNYSVAEAVRRIDMARSAVGQAEAALYPQLGVSAGYTLQRPSGLTTRQAYSPSTDSYFSLGATVSWEVDVFGKVRSRVKQARAEVDVTRAEYQGVQVSVAAQIATTYITLRTYQAQLEVAKAHIKSQERLLHMAEARHEAGLASMLDVQQARVVLYSTQATIPALETSIKTTANALSILTGTFPDCGRPLGGTPGAMPNRFHLVGIGVPADLLRRRPDVVEAEGRIAADAAALGVAKKDFLPTLSLTGSIGTSARDLTDLFKGRSYTWSVAPQLSWTVFDGFARRYACASARQQMEADIAAYNLTLQQAVGEVDNSILTYAGSLANIDLLEQTVDAARSSLDLSVDQYRSGLTSFTTVVDQQMNYLTYQNSLLSAQGNALKALVNLYQALGGGWTL